MSVDHLPDLKQSPRSRLLRHWRYRFQRWGVGTSDDAGLTLIECLAAIVVVGFIGAAMAPVLVISVATRVQSQKSEQAVALAQSEVDFVRTLMERGEGINPATDLPPEVSGLANNAVTTALGPTGSAANGNRYPATYTDARPIDIDTDGDVDFGIQVYRTPTTVTGDALAFTLGVRVYDIEAINNAAGNLPTDQASIGLTSSQGDRTRQPLATLYTTVASGEDTQSLCAFATYLGGYGIKPPLGCPQPPPSTPPTPPTP